MSEQLPVPLVPAEVDLRDFPYMPLDVRRLRDSRLVATRSPEEIVAAILLWAASWHQQPAASLPDDDLELSQLAGYGRAVKEFRKIKAGALHGLILCRDGRFYHPVVAEKAADAWNGRLEAEWRKACDRTRKENKERKERGEAESGMPTRPALLSMQHINGIPTWDYINSTGIPAERLRKSSLKGEGKGKGEGKQNNGEQGIPTDFPASPSSPPVGKTVSAGATPPAATRPSAVSEKVWRDFLAVRKAKRAPLTDTALQGIEREAGKAGMTLQAALETACARGWQGFQAAWLNGSKSHADAAAEAKRRIFGEERDITDDAARL